MHFFGGTDLLKSWFRGKPRGRRVGRYCLPPLASGMHMNHSATGCSYETPAAGDRCRQCQAAGHELPVKCIAGWEVHKCST